MARVRKQTQETQESENMTDETVSEETPETEEKAASKKTPAPEGFMTPVDFAKELSKHRGKDVPPQVIYGYLKNSKAFPKDDRGEGVTPRYVIPVAEALAYLDEQANKKAERDAAKAAKDAAAAAEDTE